MNFNEFRTNTSQQCCFLKFWVAILFGLRACLQSLWKSFHTTSNALWRAIEHWSFIAVVSLTRRSVAILAVWRKWRRTRPQMRMLGSHLFNSVQFDASIESNRCKLSQIVINWLDLDCNIRLSFGQTETQWLPTCPVFPAKFRQYPIQTHHTCCAFFLRLRCALQQRQLLHLLSLHQWKLRKEGQMLGFYSVEVCVGMSWNFTDGLLPNPFGLRAL